MDRMTDLYTTIVEDTKEFLDTDQDVIILTASGTEFWESTTLNLVEDDMLVPTSGAFSERQANVAERLGKSADRIEYEWGEAVKPEDVRDALEGLLEPEEKEKTLGMLEVRETFKIPKVGTVAGCYVLEGKVSRNNRVRLVREGVVVYEGELSSLKRFKDDVREVQNGYECGLSIQNFNDIKVGDQIESYEVVEERRKLSV